MKLLSINIKTQKLLLVLPTCRHSHFFVASFVSFLIRVHCLSFSFGFPFLLLLSKFLWPDLLTFIDGKQIICVGGEFCTSLSIRLSSEISLKLCESTFSFWLIFSFWKLTDLLKLLLLLMMANFWKLSSLDAENTFVLWEVVTAETDLLTDSFGNDTEEYLEEERAGWALFFLLKLKNLTNLSPTVSFSLISSLPSSHSFSTEESLPQCDTEHPRPGTPDTPRQVMEPEI